MAEPLKKYTDTVKKTVDALNKTTTSVDSKMRELIVMLSAINNGLIDSESKVKDALANVATGKFESESKLRGYLKTLQLVDKDANEIVKKWFYLKALTVDEIKLTHEYSLIHRELGEELDKIHDVVEETKEEIEDIKDIETDRVDLVGDLVKKYKQFSKSITDSGVSLKNVNIDLTKGSKIVESFFDLSDSVIPNLFDPSTFNFDELKKYSTDVKSLQDGWSVGQDSVQMSQSDVKVDISEANTIVGDFIKTIKPQIVEEFDLRNKKLQDYYLASKGFEGDLSAGILKDIETQQEVSKRSFEINKPYLQNNIDNLISITTLLENINSLSKDELSNLKKQFDSLEDQEKLIVGQAASYGTTLTAHLKSMKATEDELVAYDALSKKIHGFEGQIDQLGDSFREEFINVIPFGMQRMLGIDKVASQLTESLDKGMKTYIGNVAQGKTTLKASAAAMKTLGGSFTSLLGPIAIAAVAFTAIVTFVKELEGGLGEISKELQISRKTSAEIHHNILGILVSSENRFATEEDILAIQKDQLEKYGQILDLHTQSNQQLIQTAVNAQQAFGIMSTDAMEVMNVFKMLGADETLSQSLLADIGYMAEAAQMSPGMISKDLIDSAKELSLYFAGMPKQAAKAAIQIRRMGMSLKQAGQVADKMLNIEGFMTDMAELSAMSNGKLDLSKAFDLRMKGDIEGMTKSIMDEIGTLEDFNSMSEFTQRKLASTLGMEIGDLRKSVKLKEMQNSLGEDQTKLLMDNLDKVGDINNMNLANMKSKAEELNSMNRLSVAWDKIKAVLFKAITPIIESISEALSSSAGIVDLIGLGFKGLGGIIKFLSPIVKGFFLPFKIIGDVIGMITTQLEKWFEPAHKTETVMAGVNDNLLSMTGIVKGLGTVIGAFFGAKYIGKITGLNSVFGKVFDLIKGGATSTGSEVAKGLTSPGIFKTILDKFKSLNPFKSLLTQAQGTDLVKPLVENVDSKKGLLSSIWDKINPFKSLQDKASSIDITKPIVENADKSKDIIGKLMDKINPLQKADQSTDLTKTTTDIKIPTPDTTSIEKTGSIFSKISSIIDKGVEVIKKGFSTLKDFVVSIADMAMQVLTKVGEGIGNFFGGLAKGLNKFTPQALIGTAALIGIAGALWITSKAMQEFNSVNWDSLAKAGVALIGVSAIAVGIGALSELIIPGAIALGILSGALYVFGKALGVVSEGLIIMEPLISTFINGIDKVAGTVLSGVDKLLITLATMDVSQLLMIGPALLGIGAGLAVIAGGSIIQGLTSLFTSDPFTKLEKIALLADPMLIVSNSIKLLVDNLSQLGSILSSIDLDKLNDIGKSSIEINRSIQVAPNNISGVAQQQNTKLLPEMSVPIMNSYNNPNEYQSNIQNENTYSEKNTTISTAKLERLVSEMNNYLQMILSRPSIAVVGEQATKDIHSKLKGYNNK